MKCIFVKSSAFISAFPLLTSFGVSLNFEPIISSVPFRTSGFTWNNFGGCILNKVPFSLSHTFRIHVLIGRRNFSSLHHPSLRLHMSNAITKMGNLKSDEWAPLNVPPSELRCDSTLICGQSFRWQKTANDEWTGVISGKLVGPAWYLFRFNANLILKTKFHGSSSSLTRSNLE